MTWHDVTVFQWQQLAELYHNVDKMDEVDLSIKAAAIVTGRTEKQVASMNMRESMVLVDEMDFLKNQIPTGRIDHIDVDGKRYICNYDVKRMPAARYIEAKHFMKDFTGNLHRIAASLIIPTQWDGREYIRQPYDALAHEDYADDLLMAPIDDVMGAVVFFYLVYRTWIKVSHHYLVKEMMGKGMTRKMAENMYLALWTSLDGYTRLPLLPTMNASRFAMSMN